MNKRVFLGIDKTSGSPIDLNSAARWLGNYVIGIQGMGKSNLLKQIALTDIANGDGVCVLSPHPDLIEDILTRIPVKRRDDVIVFDPSDDRPIGLNIFEWEGPNSKIPLDKIVDDVVTKTFQLVWADSWGPRMEEMLANVSRTILYAQSLPPDRRPTLAEFEMIVGRGDEIGYRNFLMQHITSSYDGRAVEMLQRYWRWFDEQNKRDRETIASSTLNKARPFASNEFISNVVGQTENKVNLRKVMDDQKILLVDLNVDKLGEGNVKLIGSLFVGQLFLAALSREIESPPPRFHIIADEFGYFATPAFAQLQDQGRKFGVDVLVAHQRRGQLEAETRDATKSARNWIVFNVNPEDARELSEGFDSTPQEEPKTREREQYNFAHNPWDQLKVKSHATPEITAIISKIEEWIFSGPHDVTEWARTELGFNFEDESIVLQIFNHHDFEMEEKFELRYGRHWTLITERDIELLISELRGTYNQYLNKILYSAMICPDEVEDLLIEFGNMIFPGTTNFFAIKPLDLIILKDPSLSKDRGQKTRDEIKKHLELYDYSVEEVTNLGNIYARSYFRSVVVGLVEELASLVQKYPVYSMSGQLINEEDKPRPRADVILEWQNRFAHLPRFEAWCRIEEDNVINEYHLRTVEIEPAPDNGAEVARVIRNRSRLEYGISKKDILDQMRTRILLEDVVEEKEVIDNSTD